jgi:shikimate kinase
MSLILFGHQYSGKSVLGRYLGCRFKRPWIDTDIQIMQTYKNLYHDSLSCREIYLKHGESFFRDLESKVIIQLNLLEKQVVSLGGGSLTYKASQKHLLSNGFLLWVVCSKEILKKRTLDNLPSFYESKNFETCFNQRFEQREGLFKSLNAPRIYL